MDESRSPLQGLGTRPAPSQKTHASSNEAILSSKVMSYLIYTNSVYIFTVWRFGFVSVNKLHFTFGVNNKKSLSRRGIKTKFKYLKMEIPFTCTITWHADLGWISWEEQLRASPFYVRPASSLLKTPAFAAPRKASMRESTFVALGDNFAPCPSKMAKAFCPIKLPK